MPIWLKILITILLTTVVSFGVYQIVDQKLTEENERYIQSLVVEYSHPVAEIETNDTEPEEESTTTTESDTRSGTNAIEILFSSGSAGLLGQTVGNANTITQRATRELSIELDVVTFNRVEFRVGESWTDENGVDSYVVTKIVRTENQIQLYYETDDGEEFVFVLDKNEEGNFSILGAENITLDVDTDPDETGADDAFEDEPTNTATNNTASSNENTTTTTTPDDNTNITTIDPDDGYVVINTSTTTNNTATTTNQIDQNQEPTDTTPTETTETTPDTTPTTTETTPDTTPTTTEQTYEPDQPYWDGTYYYKANAQFVPYVPPLYDRDYSDEVGFE